MTFPLKAHHKPVKDYYTALETYARLGFGNEGAVRSAFAELLRHVARAYHLTLIEEFKVERNGSHIFTDGGLVDDFRLVHGYWEAKDTGDDLDREIELKLKKGYPRTNIIFQAPGRAVVIQNGTEVFDSPLDDPENLIEALRVFFVYRRPEIEEWRTAVDEFSVMVRQLAETVLGLIEEERRTNREFVAAYANFSFLCKRSINPNLSDAAIEEMLIQHLLTARIFSKIFNNPEFVQKNIIAAEIEKVISALTVHHFSRGDFLRPLDPFYAAIERTAATIEDYTQKQDFLNTVYEKFFQGFSVRVADTHGIVYTPQPVVNFIVNSVEDILSREFGRSLSDRDVHILDPFVGTGNFIIHVMRKIRKTELPYKYANELHCNEVMLLPYYIASMNIEHEYYTATGDYRPFDGICLVDTFELAEGQQAELFTEQNTQRVQREKSASIFVILGNPPYNAKQVNENDNNKNRKYKIVDERVKDTYAKDSSATNKNALSDAYIKAFRWASDRIGSEGIVAFVSNNSFIDGYALDGFRKSIQKEFSTIYIIDLGGNVRKNPKLSGTTHNVFGIQVGVSINILVKRTIKSQPTAIFYSRTDEFWRKERKYEYLDEKITYNNLEWQTITPDKNHTWLTSELHDDFAGFLPMGTKEGKRADDTGAETIFKNYGRGVATTRDTWAYNFDREKLAVNIKRCIDTYNDHVLRWQEKDKNVTIDDFVEYDDTKLNWSESLKNLLKRGHRIDYEENNIRLSLYRPFTKSYLYYDKYLNERRYQFPHIYPT
ncbi:N-6 DNA methylase, partial [bacterium]|nr:N-6 DNA methylase [bacterium]